jgi:DNA adenine methylase
MKVYRFNFGQEDFGKLAEVLGSLKGKFLMSLNDHKEVRRIFKGFRIQKVATKYSAMRGLDKGRVTARSELLIRNY